MTQHILLSGPSPANSRTREQMKNNFSFTSHCSSNCVGVWLKQLYTTIFQPPTVLPIVWVCDSINHIQQYFIQLPQPVISKENMWFMSSTSSPHPWNCHSLGGCTCWGLWFFGCFPSKLFRCTLGTSPLSPASWRAWFINDDIADKLNVHYRHKQVTCL